jgi:hypothetical protein
VSARRAYAELLTELRFEAGLLVRHDSEDSAVVREDLVALPGVGGAEVER